MPRQAQSARPATKTQHRPRRKRRATTMRKRKKSKSSEYFPLFPSDNHRSVLLRFPDGDAHAVMYCASPAVARHILFLFLLCKQ